MGYEYDLSLRERVLSYLEVGHGGKAEAAKVFGVARQTIYNWMKQKKLKGHLRPMPRGERKRCLDRKSLLAYFSQHPDAYLLEVGNHFRVSSTAIFKACKRWKITRKKKLILQRKRRSQTKKVSQGNRPIG